MTRRGPYGPSTIASSPITLARIRSSSGEVGRPTSPTRGGEAVTAVSLLGCQGGPASVDVHAAAQPTQVLGASEAREALPEHAAGGRREDPQPRARHGLHWAPDRRRRLHHPC